MKTGYLLVRDRIPRAGWCEHDHESSGSIKGRVIIYNSSDKLLVKKICRQLIQLAKHHGCFFFSFFSQLYLAAAAPPNQPQRCILTDYFNNCNYSKLK